LNVPSETLIAGKDVKNLFVFSELVVNGKVVSSNDHYFQPFKNLSLPRAKITAEALRTSEGFRITLSSDKLARAVYLSAPAYKGFFVDNYFDLVPGKKVEVVYRTTDAVKAADFQKSLNVRSLTDAF
jgi:beta-mannosidase